MMRGCLWTLFLGYLLCFCPAAEAQSQPIENVTPVIDTVIIRAENMFDQQQMESSFVFRLMNQLHIQTRRWVVERELLFQQNEPYNSALVNESERNLRSLRIFRSVEIDTVTVGDKLAAVVQTRDGWSTTPKFQISLQSDGTWTGLIGITETNFLGTANYLHVGYRKFVDRDGFQLATRLQRLLGSKLYASGTYSNLSDGDNGAWLIGEPFRTLDSRRSGLYGGEAAAQRVIQYRTVDPAAPDTQFFWRTAFINELHGAIAPTASPTGYVRVGASGVIRREEYQLFADMGQAIPDTVTGTVGGYVRYSRAKFARISHFNGFGVEDLNLSTSVRFYTNFAPSAFGWQRDGIGPGINVSGAVVREQGFIWGSVDANGLFDSAGLDSGTVVVNLAFGLKPAPRHATAFQIQTGIMENPAPGQEFDLGFANAPRAWEPHAFTGTRAVWASLEHRWFIWDEILNLVGVGVAGFVDYGGAWYEDQAARFGGNIGVGLRTGSALGTLPRTGRLDVAYRFGEDLIGDRWVVSFGSGIVFPRRSPAVAPGAR